MSRVTSRARSEAREGGGGAVLPKKIWVGGGTIKPLKGTPKVIKNLNLKFVGVCRWFL